MVIVIMLCALLVASPAWADMAIDKQTYTYKTVENCDIQADVYRLSDNAIQPVILWLHGGALIFGHYRGRSGCL